MDYTVLESPAGPLMIAEDKKGLHAITFLNGRLTTVAEPGWTHLDRLTSGVDRQLQEYFAGQRRTFELVYAARGTDFQSLVWKALDDIPYGETVSYADIAREIGRPKAVRAVGAANGANPWPIVRPCHRVIGANGRLTGYGGGLPLKEKLLALEALVLRGPSF